MPTAKKYVFGFTIAGKPVYAGGRTGFAVGSFVVSDSVHQYAAESNSFIALQDMPEGRCNDAQTGDGVDGYCFQGYVGENPLAASSWTAVKYSGAGNSWSSLNSVPSDAYYEGNDFPAGYSDGKIYLHRRAREQVYGGRYINEYSPLTDSYRGILAVGSSQIDIASTAGRTGSNGLMI